ncbi:hypothetical protein [Cryptosporangium phraense]|uniref:STAS domain-containing protein n=1 Tax=Cryptosporangium phraense TaxID=2593070 RepID=A0A545AZV4_9ACTN|nr:hypothetical protein [Cryptosporangium phraense]TQS46844.1 hypothetical protein FL583_00770 [Cryptosporangium phraense]
MASPHGTPRPDAALAFSRRTQAARLRDRAEATRDASRQIVERSRDLAERSTFLLRARGSGHTISLHGPIDRQASGDLDAIIHDLSGAGRGPAIVDLSDATFVGAVALNFLARLVQTCGAVQITGAGHLPLLPRMLAAGRLEQVTIFPAPPRPVRLAKAD